MQRALRANGYINPTPIQALAIPSILEGKDLLGCAQTGTGKTAAFALPILETLFRQEQKGSYHHLQALVLAPTRELALQIHENFVAYSKHSGLVCEVAFGGVPIYGQIKALTRGADVLVATPGRLLDLIHQGYVSLAHLLFFVLDEADCMLDMGFIHDIKKIIRELPEERQTLFFSATMPPEIQKLADLLLHNPVKAAVAPVASVATTIEQHVYMVASNDKKALLVHLLQEGKKEKTLIFTRTKHGADKIGKHLNSFKIGAGVIHGNKSQAARQSALRKFKAGELSVLVATDIAARGIDVDSLPRVINFDLPDVAETYVHRIGRTGRAGKDGIALSFCDADERGNLSSINKLTAQSLKIVQEHPYQLQLRSQQPSGNQRSGGNGNRRSFHSQRPNGQRSSNGQRPARNGNRNHNRSQQAAAPARG